MTYIYSIGSLIGLLLGLQIFSGLLLTFYHIPHVNNAFISVEVITNTYSKGWLLRYMHMNIASLLFAGIYFHIIRSLFYSFYIKQNKSIWFSGYLLYIIMIVISFLGYVLPWGQMSFWRTTIITNLIANVPWGNRLIEVIWGNVSVSDSTLRRFFIIHYILPFILIILIIIHLHWLHKKGTTDLNKNFNINKIKNQPLNFYFLIKDLFVLFLIIFILIIIVGFYPYIFANPVNEVKANFMAAPEHILPEWYFLPFYGILKFIPNKNLGILLMFIFILIPAFLPLFEIKLKNIKKNVNFIKNLLGITKSTINIKWITKNIKKLNYINSNFKYNIIIGSYIFFAISACTTTFNVEQCSLLLHLYFLIIIIPKIS